MMLCAAHHSPILPPSHLISSSPSPSSSFLKTLPSSGSSYTPLPLRSQSIPTQFLSINRLDRLSSAYQPLFIQHSPCPESSQTFYTPRESRPARLLDTYRISNPSTVLRRFRNPKPSGDPPNIDLNRLVCNLPGLLTP